MLTHSPKSPNLRFATPICFQLAPDLCVTTGP